MLGVGFIIRNNSNQEGYLGDMDSSRDVLSDDSGEIKDSGIDSNVSDTKINNVSEEKTFSMDEVAMHNDRNSCYSVIRGEVFDLTFAIGTHPGGPDKILALCGKDGTNAFVNKHGGSPRQENGLAKLKIGILK